MKINPNTDKINVALQEADPFSPLNYYKKLIALRKSLPVFLNGSYHIELAKHPKVWAYTRKLDLEEAYVLTNLSDQSQSVTLPNRWVNAPAMILLANYQDSSWKKTMTLRPFEAVVVKKDA